MATRSDMDVDAFFERYRAAFEAGDVDYMMAQYAVPLAVMRPSVVRVVEDLSTLHDRTAEIVATWRGRGMEHIEADGLTHHGFTPGFVVASLSWAFYGPSRALLTRIDGSYVIRPDRFEPRIVGLVAHNEYERRDPAPPETEATS